LLVHSFGKIFNPSKIDKKNESMLLLTSKSKEINQKVIKEAVLWINKRL